MTQPDTSPNDSALPSPPLGLLALSLLALGLGLFTGLGAVVFRGLIGLIHDAAFLGHFTWHYDANHFTAAAPWGAGIIMVPVIGGMVVTFLVVNFAPEARGHGVPEVMDAIFYQGGVIRPVVAVIKSLASAVAIGTGAAVGREGPIIQIGSALGSTLGQWVRMAPEQRIILVAAGAGAGIAATFNTPIGGVMFAVELMMPEIGVTSFLPTALATGAATFVGRAFFGDQPAFAVPALAPLGTNPQAAATLLLFALLGAACGLAAAGFIRGLHGAERLFERVPGRYTRHALGMAMVGLLIYILQRAYGHYYVEGVSYATIEALLNGQMTASLPVLAGFLLLLFTAKLFATSVSLGSGSSGGIFSPSLFMGATIGAALAATLQALHVPLPVSVPGFAMVGMAAMVGGSTGAAMTAVTMIFEMTRDYGIVMPMIVAVATALGVRRLLSRESIYTIKLVGRGHAIPKARHANMFMVRRAATVMERDVQVLPAETGFGAFLSAEEETGRMRHVVVTEDGHIKGVLRINMALRRGLAEAERSMTLGQLANRNFTVVRESTIAYEVIRRIWTKGALMAVVVRDNVAMPRGADVAGVITKEHVADSVAETVMAYRDE
ncbi:chloride channel protein [Acidocella sp.]|uniref:chloride channel protein n=1 Tax=Acidocella sp. TaxID=50710 RepID=UPI00262029CD|nr:chloride channel protein [Acidocella sp.]